MLPSDQFDVKITSSKDNIANLLSSAMMTGYFLRQMEQRKELEQTLKNDENMSIEE
jgi:23S rRNA G2069 N7-methylase RlmK/C1962 C5-methylase RlmI